MPGWGQILAELQASPAPNGAPDLDGVRRKYLRELQQLTGRSVVLYATDWMGKGGPQTSVSLVDMQGLMEVFNG